MSDESRWADTVVVEMLPTVFKATEPTTFRLNVSPPWEGPVHQEPVRSHMASQLADLESMGHDLRRAIELCDRLDHDDSDDLTRSALWEAAVIAYGRCFNTGRASMTKAQRRKFPKRLLDKLTTELQQTHERALKDRNQHVGHRVNDGEQVIVNAVRAEPDGPVQGLAVGFVRLLHPTDHCKLRDLARQLHRQLQPELEREREQLLEYLESANPRS